MPVPTSITDCNATAANNSPAGSDSIGTSLDDYLRAHAAILRQVYDSSLIPSGTKMPFAQSAAPTGWTQDTTDNSDNRMLRVVKTAGGSVAGSHSPILCNVVPSHTHGITTGTESVGHSHTFTTGTVSADHNHGVTDPGHDHDIPVGSIGGGAWGFTNISQLGTVTTYGRTTGVSLSGMSADHTHSGTTSGASVGHAHSGTTDNGSSQTNWTPRYIDMIICSKN